jgi:hypothetical protein
VTVVAAWGSVVIVTLIVADAPYSQVDVGQGHRGQDVHELELAAGGGRLEGGGGGAAAGTHDAGGGSDRHTLIQAAMPRPASTPRPSPLPPARPPSAMTRSCS